VVKIGIVGHGIVGSAMARLFTDAVIYDKFQAPHNTEEKKAEINTCELVFVCVPTPAAADGSCDISAVRECVGWVQVPMCIKSTVPPGTTESLIRETGKQLAFSPEHIGEHESHPWRTEAACGYVIIGGTLIAIRETEVAYLMYGPALTEYFIVDSPTVAEMSKYMVNCSLAIKVTLANQFKDACDQFGIDYEDARKLWAMDPRVGETHTFVTKQRGYGGSCFPKDMKSLAFEAKGKVSVIDAAIEYNNRVRVE